MSKISIIIPTLNEEAYIGKLLEHVLANASSKNILEILVVDGGSTDQTKNIANHFFNFTNTTKIKAYNYISNSLNLSTKNKAPKISIQLLNSKKGRAKQMNFGAKHAKGNVLYFLHADSFPPKNFDELILTEIKKNNLAGCFKMQFNSKHWWLKLSGWFTQFNWRACRGGDQSQFITKWLFDNIGGFNENYIVYEDNILINELYTRKQFVVINKTLKTSARMYHKHGVWKLQYVYWSIYIKKWLGANANQLYKYYQNKLS